MGDRPCRGPFPPFMGAFFSMWRVLFYGLFSPCFSPYVENFLGLSTVQLTKISHAFATIVVVPNMSSRGNLGEIARLNRSVGTFWSTYFHIMFRKSMK